MDFLSSVVKVVVGMTVMAVAATLQILVLILLLPSRSARIRSCNYWGKVVGRVMMWLSGCPLTIRGQEHLRGDRPAIYVSNHTSIFDIFLAIFLSPVGTVGVAKKQVVWYPFFGLLYLLSGHLRIDRGNGAKAIASIQRLGELVRSQGLSIYIWPEGTRSRDGRLLPFKKGIFHLAKQTGLPIVPIVITGAHRGWEKSTLKVKKTPITVEVLPAVDTAAWTAEAMEEHLMALWQQYRAVLPDDQQPHEAVAPRFGHAMAV